MELKYELMLFDLDNTLICFETAQKKALEKVLIRNNFPYSEDCLNRFRKINDQLWHSFEMRKISKSELFVTRFRMLLKGASEGKCHLINEEFLTYLSEDPVTLPGVEDFLEQIRGHCVSGIITNGDSLVQWRKFNQMSCREHFDFMIVSEDVGFPKPAPEIFQAALKKAGLPGRRPEKVLMTGDNLNADIRGALQAGLDACWYNPESRPRPGDLRPTFEVRHFSGLLDSLKH